MKPKSHFKYFICSNCGATASGNPSQAPICCGNSMLEISREIHDQQAEANKAAYRIKSQQEVVSITYGKANNSGGRAE